MGASRPMTPTDRSVFAMRPPPGAPSGAHYSPAFDLSLPLQTVQPLSTPSAPASPSSSGVTSLVLVVLNGAATPFAAAGDRSAPAGHSTLHRCATAECPFCPSRVSLCFGPWRCGGGPERNKCPSVFFSLSSFRTAPEIQFAVG